MTNLPKAAVEPSPDTKDLSLSVLLELLVMGSRCDGAMICTGASADRQTVLSSWPEGLVGRGQRRLAPDLLGVCGQGLVSSAGLLLPAATVSWLGYTPQAVLAERIATTEGESYLFLWWQRDGGDEAQARAAAGLAASLLAGVIERHTVAASLRQLEDRLDAVLANVSLGIVFIDLLRGSLVNPIAAELLGLPPETRDTSRVVAAMRSTREGCTVEHARDLEDVPGATAGELTEYWIWKDRERVLRVESHEMGGKESPGRFWVFTDVKPLWDSGEKLKSANKVLQRNISLLAEEMQRRLEAEEELRRYNLGLRRQNEELEIGKLQSDLLANQDQVTGLANARRFHRALEEMLEDGRREPGIGVAVLFLDLDRFKQVNDTYGHEEGDRLLRAVGDLLARTLRRDDVIARMGGDEFACAMRLSGPEGYADLAALARRLNEALHITVDGGDGAVEVTASIGIAVYPEHATDVASLLRAADKAMYVSKRSGRCAVTFFGHGDAVLVDTSVLSRKS